MQIKSFLPQSTDQWYSDERGLRLLIKPNGSCYWRMKYRFHGKQKTLALGVFPEVSLKDARIARDKARLQIAEGVDPNEDKQRIKREEALDGGEAFSNIAKQWWEHQKGTWDESHAVRVWRRLEKNANSELDRRPFDKIRPQDILQTIRDIEQRDALDVAARTLQDIRRVFRYAVQMGKLSYNPASDLTGVVKTRRVTHRASLPNSELGQFICDLRQYKTRGRLLTQLALELLTLTFVRPGELEGARWDEFDFADKLWRIPAERMKMNTAHLVPLSDQAISILREIEAITHQYSLVFPSEKDRNQSMSNGTLRLAMFRMGYDGKTKGKTRATPHGFRANASSIMNEKGFNADAIERQLSHVERNKVRAAYMHHAQFLDERRKMMQWWADHLDTEVEQVMRPDRAEPSTH